jgi:hypothetical protein
MGGKSAITSVGILIEELKQVLSLTIICKKIATNDALKKTYRMRGCRLFTVLPKSSLDGSVRHSKCIEDDLDVFRTARHVVVRAIRINNCQLLRLRLVSLVSEVGSSSGLTMVSYEI